MNGDEQSEGRGGSEPLGPSDGDALLLVRSFVVRAILEANADSGRPAWHGFVTDVATGRRVAWRRPGEIARFVEARLSEAGAREAGVREAGAREAGVREAGVREAGPGRGRPGVAAASVNVAAPPLTDVVGDMLALLEARLPSAVPDLPDPNVTIERVRERLVGLGNRRGARRTGPLGRAELKGGRLDATVRYQLWGASATDVDGAVAALHADLLDDRDLLRADGFLKVTATDTTLAEPVDVVGGWRKTASYEVLYEYRYEDVDGARGLIARVTANTDPESRGSPDREVTTVTDEMVRWGEDAAPELAVSGPRVVSRLAALTFLPGPVPTGTVTMTRTSTGATGPPTHHGDLVSFLAAVSGPQPAETHADVTLPLADLLAALAPAGTPIDLGANGGTDTYVGSQLVIDPPLTLAQGTEQFALTYSDPAGFDHPAVAYLRLEP